MYLYAINNSSVKKISHKFLTVGHIQNEGVCIKRKRTLKIGSRICAIQSERNGKWIKFRNLKKLSQEIGRNFWIKIGEDFKVTQDNYGFECKYEEIDINWKIPTKISEINFSFFTS